MAAGKMAVYGSPWLSTGRKLAVSGIWPPLSTVVPSSDPALPLKFYGRTGYALSSAIRLCREPGGDRVGGVPVQGVAAAIVAAGGAGVSVPGGVLDILEGTPASRAPVMNATHSE